MNIEQAKEILSERAAKIVERVISDRAWMEARYQDVKNDPTLIMYTTMELESRIRFDMAVDPVSVFGSEYLSTQKYDDVVDSIRNDAVERAGKAIYRDLWK